MSTVEAIAEHVKVLSPERQQDVLDLVEFIRSRVRTKKAAHRSRRAVRRYCGGRH